MASSLSRRRAAFAYQRLVGAGDKKELAQILKGLPIQVRNQGLSTVLALLISRDDSHDDRTVRTVLELTVDWLTNDQCATKPVLDLQQGDPDTLLRWCIVEADNASYRAVQAEVLALLGQAKILAAALVASNERTQKERTGPTNG